jgi:hypothetical protein
MKEGTVPIWVTKGLPTRPRCITLNNSFISVLTQCTTCFNTLKYSVVSFNLTTTKRYFVNTLQRCLFSFKYSFKAVLIDQLTLLKLTCRFQWPRGLRRRSATARPLRWCVRIPPGTWKSVCCDCCVISGRGLCDELITWPEESYRLWCVVRDLETSWMRRPWPNGGLSRQKQRKLTYEK